MLINPVGLPRMSRHVVEALLKVAEKASAKKPDDTVLLTAVDALTFALKEPR